MPISTFDRLVKTLSPYLWSKRAPPLDVRYLFIKNSGQPDSKSVELLGVAFRLLSYVSKYWLDHCSNLSKGDQNWELFADLVLWRTLPVRHLPWDTDGGHNVPRYTI